jgi:toxin CptA
MYIGIVLNYNLNPAFARLTINIAPNWLLALIFTCMGILACLCLLVAPIPAWWKLLVACVMATLTIYSILEHALLRLPSSIKQLAFRQQQWVMTDAKAVKHHVKLQGSSFVSAYFSVINLTVEGERFTRSILIIPSRVDADAFRRLRIVLRWHKDISHENLEHN